MVPTGSCLINGLIMNYPHPRELAVFISRNMGASAIFFMQTKGQRTTFKKLGSSSKFPFRKHSKNVFGNMGDTRHFPREYGNTDPLGGLSTEFIFKIAYDTRGTFSQQFSWTGVLQNIFQPWTQIEP